ncbi:hypothetical protein [Neobacillus drentensis]
MEESKLLTEQKFQQILFKTISSAQENEKIRVTELIEEIKQQIISLRSEM